MRAVVDDGEDMTIKAATQCSCRTVFG